MNILQTLNNSQLNRITYLKCEKDKVLFRENDICDAIGIVLKGQISIVTYFDNGKEVIFNTINQNEIFGNNLIFSSEPFFKGNIITNVDSEIALIKKNDLIYLLSKNNDFMVEYLKIQSNFAKQLNNKIKLLSIESAEERFYFYMYENQNRIEFSTVTDLAKKLYLSREALSRLLSKLVSEKKIKRNLNTIEII